MEQIKTLFKQSDWLLFFATFMLVAFGLSAIYSVALSQEGSNFLFIKKQLIAFGIGAILMLLMTMWNYRLLRSYSVVFYAAAVIMLVAVLFLGVTVRGTTGWFSLPGFNFQPVEFAKIALAISLAHYFSARARRDFGLREFVETGLMAFIPVALTLLQPDLGSALILFSLWIIAVLFAGIKKRYMLSLLVLGILGSVFAWHFLLADYQQARLMTFVNPEFDPLGQGYNVTQAIIAVGSGEWLGRGLGFGSQSQLKFLPESQTDFIFAVIAEELGFLGVVLLLSAFFLLFQRILRHSARTHDDFTSFLLIGIGGLLFVQFVVNVGMNLGLLPVTGVALPFVSYGGSSLVVSLGMIGIIESAVVRTSSSYTRFS